MGQVISTSPAMLASELEGKKFNGGRMRGLWPRGGLEATALQYHRQSPHPHPIIRAPMCLDGPGRGHGSWGSRRSSSAASGASARTGMHSSWITTHRKSSRSSRSGTRSKSGRTPA